jgi:hypothetical protein
MHEEPYDDADDTNSRCVRGKRVFDADALRYVVSSQPGGQVVVDEATGLVWQAEYAESLSWKEALEYCESRPHCGYRDWRLPNINELRSLVDVEVHDPASRFPDMPSDWFWSSSSCLEEAAWCVQFESGVINHPFKKYMKDYPRNARCVRGGP